MTRSIFAATLIALAASSFTAQAGNFRAAPTGPATADTEPLVHDSKAQIDVWVANCSKAGGGMVLDQGNYDCVTPGGKSIPDW